MPVEGPACVPATGSEEDYQQHNGEVKITMVNGGPHVGVNDRYGEEDEEEGDEEDDEEGEEVTEKDPVEKMRQSSEAIQFLYQIQPLLDALNTVELSSNDVIIAGFQKTGTNWLEQICHQIRTKGTDESFEELTDEVPLLQLYSIPLGFDLNIPQKGEHKLFKTHDILCHLPKSANKCKFIVLFRNPLDTLASFYRWEPAFTGYDPSGAISIEDFFDYKFNYKKHKVPLTYWEFLSTWLDDYKLLENCLFVFYEDMCSNFDATLERIRQFMGTTLTASERERVKYLSSFQYMKQNETKFDLHGLRQKIRDLADLEEYEMEETETPAFLNQGANRKGKQEIPDHIQEVMRTEWHDCVATKYGFESYEDFREKLSSSS